MVLRYIDSHAHLFFDNYRDDLDAVLERAKNAGVCAVVIPGTDLQSSRQAVELADRYEQIYACVGYHPHDASKAIETGLVEIEELSKHPKVVAIGEIGLDYHYEYSPRALQKEIFTAHLELAVRRDLPCVVHTRESMQDTIDAVKLIVKKYPTWRPSGEFPRRGVFHCFPGTAEEALELRTLGFWVSYTGNATFKNSTAMSMIKAIGYQNILLETDSPYMTPVPFRGRRNEPAFVVLTAQKIADSLQISEEDIAMATTMNASHLFSLNIAVP